MATTTADRDGSEIADPGHRQETGRTGTTEIELVQGTVGRRSKGELKAMEIHIYPAIKQKGGGRTGLLERTDETTVGMSEETTGDLGHKRGMTVEIAIDVHAAAAGHRGTSHETEIGIGIETLTGDDVLYNAPPFNITLIHDNIFYTPRLI